MEISFAVVNQFEAKVSIRRVVIAKGESMVNVVSEFITILVLPHNQGGHVPSGQVTEVLAGGKPLRAAPDFA